MTVKLLTDYHLEFLSLKEGSTGSSDSTLVKMPHCWKSHLLAHLMLQLSCKCLLFAIVTSILTLIGTMICC